MIRQVFRGKALICAAMLLAGVAGCHAAPEREQAEAAAGEGGYVSPPTISEASVSAGGVILRGEAPAGSPVRLANPGGAALSARADDEGRWRMVLPLPPEPRIYGLSVQSGERKVQAQGYVLIGPRGQAALLRAGAGALRLDHPGKARISTVDFDADGGALVSGFAQAGTDVSVRVDGRLLGETRADPTGRFSYAVARLPAGAHRLEATGVGFSDILFVEATPAPALTSGPLRAQVGQGSLRADWLTPGGGVQSTILAG